MEDDKYSKFFGKKKKKKPAPARSEKKTKPAAKKPVGKKKTPTKKPTKALSKPTAKKKPVTPKEKEHLPQWEDPETEEMLEKIRSMKQKIQDKLGTALSEGGLGFQEVENYLENPGNFSDKEWKRLETKREEVLESLSLGKKQQKARQAKKKTLSKKKRRKKTLGARKKWLSM